MKIAFYKAQDGTWVDKVIAWRTGGPYSHCEFVFDNPHPRITDPEGCFNCWSSTWQDGTRWATITNLNDPEKWTLVDLPFDAETVKSIIAWCDAHTGLEYDFQGIMHFAFPWQKGNPKDLFCSEALTEALQQVLGWFSWLKAYDVDPNKLYERVENKLYVMRANEKRAA